MLLLLPPVKSGKHFDYVFFILFADINLMNSKKHNIIRVVNGKTIYHERIIPESRNPIKEKAATLKA